MIQTTCIFKLEVLIVEAGVETRKWIRIEDHQGCQPDIKKGGRLHIKFVSFPIHYKTVVKNISLELSSCNFQVIFSSQNVRIQVSGWIRLIFVHKLSKKDPNFFNLDFSTTRSAIKIFFCLKALFLFNYPGGRVGEWV